jgi:hypothetical protein
MGDLGFPFCPVNPGIPAYILVGMQTDYNLQVASKDKKLIDRLNEIRKVAAVFLA